MRRLLLAVLCAAACHSPPPDGPAPAAALVDVEWQLVELNGEMAPPGADWHQATLLLSSDGAQASGYAGCNRFTTTYTLSRDSLTFGPVALTRMACTEGQALEDGYTKALTATRTQRLKEGHLELLADRKVLARFKQ